MAERYSYSSHVVHNLKYHIIWCSKYRRKVLLNPIDTRLKELIMEKAFLLGVTVHEMEVMPDHVHLFIEARPIDSPHNIAGQIKGYTSRILRQEFVSLRTRLPALWTRSYYVESVGHISEETIKRYIQDQKNN